MKQYVHADIFNVSLLFLLAVGCFATAVAVANGGAIQKNQVCFSLKGKIKTASDGAGAVPDLQNFQICIYPEGKDRLKISEGNAEGLYLNVRVSKTNPEFEIRNLSFQYNGEMTSFYLSIYERDKCCYLGKIINSNQIVKFNPDVLAPEWITCTYVMDYPVELAPAYITQMNELGDDQSAPNVLLPSTDGITWASTEFKDTKEKKLYFVKSKPQKRSNDGYMVQESNGRFLVWPPLYRYSNVKDEFSYELTTYDGHDDITSVSGYISGRKGKQIVIFFINVVDLLQKSGTPFLIAKKSPGSHIIAGGWEYSTIENGESLPGYTNNYVRIGIDDDLETTIVQLVKDKKITIKADLKHVASAQEVGNFSVPVEVSKDNKSLKGKLPDGSLFYKMSWTSDFSIDFELEMEPELMNCFAMDSKINESKELVIKLNKEVQEWPITIEWPGGSESDPDDFQVAVDTGLKTVTVDDDFSRKELLQDFLRDETRYVIVQFKQGEDAEIKLQEKGFKLEMKKPRNVTCKFFVYEKGEKRKTQEIAREWSLLGARSLPEGKTDFSIAYESLVKNKKRKKYFLKAPKAKYTKTHAIIPESAMKELCNRFYGEQIMTVYAEYKEATCTFTNSEFAEFSPEVYVKADKYYSFREMFDERDNRQYEIEKNHTKIEDDHVTIKLKDIRSINPKGSYSRKTTKINGDTYEKLNKCLSGKMKWQTLFPTENGVDVVVPSGKTPPEGGFYVENDADEEWDCESIYEGWYYVDGGINGSEITLRSREGNRKLKTVQGNSLFYVYGEKNTVGISVKEKRITLVFVCQDVWKSDGTDFTRKSRQLRMGFKNGICAAFDEKKGEDMNKISYVLQPFFCYKNSDKALLEKLPKVTLNVKAKNDIYRALKCPSTTSRVKWDKNEPTCETITKLLKNDGAISKDEGTQNIVIIVSYADVSNFTFEKDSGKSAIKDIYTVEMDDEARAGAWQNKVTDLFEEIIGNN